MTYPCEFFQLQLRLSQRDVAAQLHVECLVRGECVRVVRWERGTRSHTHIPTSLTISSACMQQERAMHAAVTARVAAALPVGMSALMRAP